MGSAEHARRDAVGVHDLHVVGPRVTERGGRQYEPHGGGVEDPVAAGGRLGGIEREICGAREQDAEHADDLGDVVVADDRDDVARAAARLLDRRRDAERMPEKVPVRRAACSR